MFSHTRNQQAAIVCVATLNAVCVRTMNQGYIAQWLERLTADQQVPGSNPGVPFDLVNRVGACGVVNVGIANRR